MSRDVRSHRFKCLVLGLVASHNLLIMSARVTAQDAEWLPVEARVVEAVCDKQVVVLGELPSHGEAHAFQSKARLVRRLVDQCGFDALLFEAPIYDFIGFQNAVAQASATPSQLDDAIGRFWLTRELADWRHWLFQQATQRGLVLGGLDDQISATSQYARTTLPNLVAAVLPATTAAECEQAIARHLYWRYDAAQQFDEPERIRLQRCARLAADSAGVRARDDTRSSEQVMLDNFAGYMSRQQSPADAPDRDEAMYRNFGWHHERIRGDPKVIIWTATVHAARQQGVLPRKPLGSWLSEQWADRLAVVGFSALAGQTSMAGRPSTPLPEAPPGSLEARVSDAAWTFLHSSALHAIGDVPSRLLGEFTSADWSIYFDVVLVIRQEVAPIFEPRR